MQPPEPLQQRESRPIQRPTDVVLDDTQSRTVRVFNGSSQRRAAGAGVVVSYRGHHFVLTALHVITGVSSRSDQKALDDAVDKQNLEVEFWNGERSAPVFFSAIPMWDIVMMGPVKVPHSVASSRFLDSTGFLDAKVGDAFIVWGAPYGYGPVPLVGRYSAQTMTQHSIVEGGKEVAIPGGVAFGMEVGVGAQPGHSGGPVFDLQGNLLGVVSYSWLENDGILSPVAAGFQLSTYWKVLLGELDKFLVRAGLITTPTSPMRMD